MTQRQNYIGHSVVITAAENGYLIHVNLSGPGVSLVAKDWAEMLALLSTVEIKPPVYGVGAAGEFVGNTAGRALGGMR